MIRFFLVFLLGCTTQATLGDGTGTPTGSAAVCDDVVAQLETELDRIQSCSTAEDCGQVLTGTSCGCTRDLVARRDADLGAFDALVAEGLEAECDLGFTSPCDCPAAEGYACVGGTCAWNYVDGGGDVGLPACQAADGDTFTVDKLAVEGHELVVGVAYSGGCEEHQFRLCWPSQAFAESEPVQARLELLHDANGDSCEAWISEDRRFDLRPLSQSWHASYGDGPGTIVVFLGDRSDSYSF